MATECPHCWNIGSNLRTRETKLHYITECPFCGTLIITPKENMGEARKMQEKARKEIQKEYRKT